MATDRRRKTDLETSPFQDPEFRRRSVHFDDIEFQRRFEQNLIRYGLVTGAAVTKEINNTVLISGGGGGGHVGCYWTKEGSNVVYWEGNVGVKVHPRDNDFEVKGNALIEHTSEAPYLELRNWSDTEYDPTIRWSLGASPIAKYIMGVDDSDSDAWLLCAGDALQSTQTAAGYTLERTYTGFILIADSLNYRVHTYTTAGVRVASSGDGSSGNGDDEYNGAYGICNDGTYCYITDWGNDRIVKRLISDQTFVAKIGSAGSGDDQFNNPTGICTDGTWLYICDSANHRIVKRLCSDLSFVAKATTHRRWDNGGDVNFAGPDVIATDGTYLWIIQNSPGAGHHFIKLYCSSLATVSSFLNDGDSDAATANAIFVAGDYIYFTNSNDPATYDSIYKYDKAWGFVSHYLAGGSVVAHEVYQAYGADSDGTSIYLYNSANDASDPQEVQKRILATGSWVAEFGTYGNTINDFYGNNIVSLCSTYSWTDYRPLTGPIIKAANDLSYCDVYPLFRARAAIHLMEYGVVGATDYVGLYPPTAITTSYSLTFPGTGPAATGHFSVASGGQISWGQNVNTTASPTFVTVKCTALSNGYVPYHVSDTSGLANTNIYISGTKVLIGDTADANVEQGLCINQGAYDSTILSFKSSDVAHGMTGSVETDSWGVFYKAVAASGGIRERGFTEATIGLWLEGDYTTGNTTKTSAGSAAVCIVAGKKSGTSGIGDMGADENILAIQKFVTSAATSVWICDEDGDTWQAGTMTANAIAVTDTTVVTNLNADMVDGLHYTSFAQVYISATASPTVDDDIDNYREGCIWIEQDADAVWFCADNADGAAVWRGINQGLRTTDTPTFNGADFGNVDIDGANGYVKAGVADTTRGIYYAYGSATGSAFGGSVFCSLADDYNAVISAFNFMPYEDDLLIGPDTNVDALKLASTDDLYITAGSLVLPASEYVNFGGTLGSGGYGIRDNAGTMEFCNSGGAWTAF